MTRGRKPNYYYQFIKDDVLCFVSNNPGASINEVSEKCNIGWSTAKRYLVILEKEGFLSHRTLGKRIKTYFRKREKKRND